MIVVLLYLGNNDKKKMVHVQYRHSRDRPNYIAHASSNITPPQKNVFDPWLVESSDVEPMDMEG